MLNVCYLSTEDFETHTKPNNKKHNLSIRTQSCNCFDLVSMSCVSMVEFLISFSLSVWCVRLPCLFVMRCYENDETSHKHFGYFFFVHGFFLRFVFFVWPNLKLKRINDIIDDSHSMIFSNRWLNVCVRMKWPMCNRNNSDHRNETMLKVCLFECYFAFLCTPTNNNNQKAARNWMRASAHSINFHFFSTLNKFCLCHFYRNNGAF